MLHTIFHTRYWNRLNHKNISGLLLYNGKTGRCIKTNPELIGLAKVRDKHNWVSFVTWLLRVWAWVAHFLPTNPSGIQYWITATQWFFVVIDRQCAQFTIIFRIPPRQSRLFYTPARLWFNNHNRKNSRHTSCITHHPKGTDPTSTQKLNKEVCCNSCTNMPNVMQGHSFQREGVVNAHNKTDWVSKME